MRSVIIGAGLLAAGFLAWAGNATPVRADAVGDLLDAARAAEGRGNLNDAIGLYGQAFAQPMTPDREANALINRGIDYFGIGRSDAALEDFNAALKLKPDLVEGYVNRGAIYYTKHIYDRAIADYDVAIRLAPNQSQAYYNRGDAYYDMGDYDHAFADYDRTIQLDPGNALAFVKRGTVYYYNKDLTDRAILDYNTAIRLAPSAASPYLARGLAYDDIGQADNAIADYTSAIDLKANWADAYVARGNAYRGKGLYPQAIADYNFAVRFSTHDARPFFERARAEYFANDDLAAIQDLQQATKLAPLYGYAVLWLHIARLRAGETDTQEFAVNAGMLDRVAWPGPIIALYLGAAQPGRVIDIAHADPGYHHQKTCEADYYVGMNYLLTGQSDAGKRLLESAAAGCLTSSGDAQAAKAELAFLKKS